MTQQAVRLGYAPRLRNLHTSGASVGQIYVPLVNAILFVAVVGLVIGFGSSSRLAAAFGLAVTATMVLTTLMIGYVIFRIWALEPAVGGPALRDLLLFDLGLFAASATKFAASGWLPATVAIVLVTLFATWQKGRTLVKAELEDNALAAILFLATAAKAMRVPGLAVYLTSSGRACRRPCCII